MQAKNRHLFIFNFNQMNNMKTFISKFVIFVVVFVVILHAVCIFLPQIPFKSILGEEIYVSITKSKKRTSKKKLLIGDSVGQQLFPNNKDNSFYTSLACNQSIGMVGHYILVKNYLDAGNQIDTLYCVFSPFSFQNNLDQIFTYQYFCKPFYKSEYKPYFTQTVQSQINKIPFSKFCQYPLILKSEWSPRFTSKDSVDYNFLSTISVEYLNEIRKLSEKHGFKIIILPTPIIEKNKEEVGKFNKFEAVGFQLENEFDFYFKNIEYFPDSCFYDQVHLKQPELFVRLYKDKGL